MLSYQHGFHAGNRADVLKHAVLDVILRARDDVRALYVETHAGRGAYDLEGEQARKTGEAESGVLALLRDGAPRPLTPWLELVRERGVGAYPGSPLLAGARLGADDRIVLFEQHPTEFDALKAACADDARIQLKKGDGYSGALNLAPRRGEDMIVFVDPSYESLRDMDALAEWTPRALRRWPRATIILWLPLYQDGREADFGAYLSDLETGVVAGARWPDDPLSETALEGSAIVAYRLADEAGEAALSVAAALQSHWSSA